jgi:L-asparaginase
LVQNGFNDNIVCLTLVPGLSNGLLQNMIASGVRGFVFRSFGSGDIPEYLFPFLLDCQTAGVPVINTTQCPNGKTVMGINEIGRRAEEEFGVIPAYDMSMEAMTTKLMWLLHRNDDIAAIRRAMKKSYANEINEDLVKGTKVLLDRGILETGGRL